MLAVFKLIETIAPTNSTILVTGESGTGKELVARAIHFNSLRRDRPFVAVNCGALPEQLLESVLFGHMRGSLTGASSNKRGLIEVADCGTIFLDEIGEMSPMMQVKLLTKAGFDLETHVKNVERDYIAQALKQAGGKPSRAAELLGMSFRSFRLLRQEIQPQIGDRRQAAGGSP